MDLKQYYEDFNKTVAVLNHEHPDHVVHVTSLFYRERNSTPGATISVTTRNAARVITDGTHRLASEEEIDRFYDHQKSELEKHLLAEQKKKQQFMVLTPTNQPEPMSAPAARTASQASQAKVTTPGKPAASLGEAPAK